MAPVIRQRPRWPAPTAALAGKQFLKMDLPSYIRQLVKQELARPRSGSNRGRRGAGSELQRRRWWSEEKERRTAQAKAHVVCDMKPCRVLLQLRSLLLANQVSAHAINNWRGACAARAHAVLYPDVHAPPFVPRISPVKVDQAVLRRSVHIQARASEQTDLIPRLPVQSLRTAPPASVSDPSDLAPLQCEVSASGSEDLPLVGADVEQGSLDSLPVDPLDAPASQVDVPPKSLRTAPLKQAVQALANAVALAGYIKSSVTGAHFERFLCRDWDRAFVCCSGCGMVPDQPLKVCSRCKGVAYCSQACQRGSWKDHKPHCFKFDQVLWDIVVAAKL